MPKYKRVLLKVSGEVLMGKKEFGHDPETIQRICNEIKEVVNLGTEICLVVGGGNIFRGVSAAASHGMERASADYIGMLATVMNALALQNSLEISGVETRVLSAIDMKQICETYVRRRAARHMAKGRVVIFAAGTGNPFFTTDTAAALRAIEMGCDALMKGTSVDGVYSADPKKDKNAVRYENVSYQTVLSDNLKVMDASAISLCRENNIPIVVFSIREEHEFKKVLLGGGKSTIISN